MFWGQRKVRQIQELFKMSMEWGGSEEERGIKNYLLDGLGCSDRVTRTRNPKRRK